MKTLLALGTSILIATACSAEPEIITADLIHDDGGRAMFVIEQLAYLCNEEMNLLPDVSCSMSIEHWSMDLTLPVGNVLTMELEQVTTLFCKIGEVVGYEPRITVNGLRSHCGGIEI